MWPDYWRQNISLLVWPIFHGSVILPYILNTICWINVTPGILVPCDPIIDVKIYLCWCEREGAEGVVKALLQLANFTLGPDSTLNTEIHKNSVRVKAPNSVNASKRKHKNQINHFNKQRRVLMANSTVCQSKWKPVVEPRRAKPKTYRQAPTHWLKFYEEAVIESEARTAVVQLKSEA